DLLRAAAGGVEPQRVLPAAAGGARTGGEDRKSTRLNSSHVSISYAVFCLKKKKNKKKKKKKKKKRKRNDSSNGYIPRVTLTKCRCTLHRRMTYPIKTTVTHIKVV